MRRPRQRQGGAGAALGPEAGRGEEVEPPGLPRKRGGPKLELISRKKIQQTAH